MESGYLITHNGTDALELFEGSKWMENDGIPGAGIRFAASLSDGKGICAYDGDPIGLRFFGRLLPTRALFHPWFTPKRAHATGNEHFALVSVEFLDYLKERFAPTEIGIAQVTEGLLLVESTGPIAAGNVWTAAVESFKDARLIPA